MSQQPKPLAGPRRDGGPRYQPARRLIDLALMLAATRAGLTIDEMAAGLGVARRTAERLKSRLDALFPQLEPLQIEADRALRWRLPSSAITGITEPKAETVAAIESAARDHEVRGETERARLLRDGALTLRMLMRPEALRRAEPDIDALMEAEGIAMRPGPRAMMRTDTLRILRQAVLAMRLLAIVYTRPGASSEEAPATRLLCPYGILYGGRGWLVAHVEGLPDMRLWRLDRIVSADLLDRTFSRREDFVLQTNADRSFGVFQDEPSNVVLRFAASAAEEAQAWLFHPTQKTERQPDGALLVTFRAGGLRETCWHLCQWSDTVRVMSLPILKELMSTLTTTAAERHG